MVKQEFMQEPIKDEVIALLSLPPAKQYLPYSESFLFDNEHIIVVNVDVLEGESFYYENKTGKIKGQPQSTLDVLLKVDYFIRTPSENEVLSTNELGEKSESSLINNHPVNEGSSVTYENLNKRYLSQSNNEIQSNKDISGNESSRLQQAEVRIKILADKKSHWQTIASDPAFIFYKPDVETKWFGIPIANDKTQNHFKQILGARTRGSLNAHLGKSVPDDFFVNQVNTGWHIAIMSTAKKDAQAGAKATHLLSKQIGYFLSDRLSSKVFTQELERAAQLYVEATQELSPDRLTKNDYWDLESVVKLLSSTSSEIDKKILSEHNQLYEKVASLIFDSLSLGIDSLYEYLSSDEARLNGITLNDLQGSLSLLLLKKIANKWFIVSFSLDKDSIAIVTTKGVSRHKTVINEETEVPIYLSKKLVDEAQFIKYLNYSFVEQLDGAMILNEGANYFFFDDLTSSSPESFNQSLSKMLQESFESKDPEINLLKRLKKWSQGHQHDKIALLIF